MKVLFHSYNVCFQNVAGGMQSRIKKIKDLLNENGISVDYFSPTETKVEEYDIIHFFRLDFENYALAKYAKEKGLKIIISAVIPLIGGNKIDVLRTFSFLPVLTTYKMQKEQFDLADLIITETKQELDFIARHYDINKSKIEIIPNGVTLPNINIENKEIFDACKFNDDYILSVGRFDENKNQLNLIKAVNQLDYHLVLVGGASQNSEEYFKKCKEEANGNSRIHFLGWLDSQSTLLSSAYSNCKLFILPSYKETFGLVLLEAGLCGARVAMSKTLPILDYEVFDRELTFAPNNVSDIKEVIRKSFEMPRDEELKNRIIMKFSWDMVINQHIKYYKSLLLAK